MKVLYVTHQRAVNQFGGAEVQIAKTKEYVNRVSGDVNVKLFDMWNDKIRDFDLVHMFQPAAFPSESLGIAELAAKGGTKVAVSTIFYPLDNMIRGERGLLTSLTWRAYASVTNKLSRFAPFETLEPYGRLGRLLRHTDIILPNTREEAGKLSGLYPWVSNKKTFVVPNGVDPKFESGTSDKFVERYGLQGFVLFVGRITKRKNLLRLIRAFVSSDLDTDLVIIGEPIEEEYFELCRKLSTDKVKFFSPIPADSELLVSAYKAAKVTVLPSYYETPGLVALEGGLAGSNLVVTKVGGTKEYFEDLAWFIDPMSEKSIQSALIEAFNSSRNRRLSEHIAKNFTWPIVAQKTLKAYEYAIHHD